MLSLVFCLLSFVFYNITFVTITKSSSIQQSSFSLVVRLGRKAIVKPQHLAEQERPSAAGYESLHAFIIMGVGVHHRLVIVIVV